MSGAALARYPELSLSDVHCCCGEHSMDAPCGCPTCPSAHSGDDEDHRESQISRCGGPAVCVFVGSALLASPIPGPEIERPVPTAPARFVSGVYPLPKSPLVRPPAPDS